MDRHLSLRLSALLRPCRGALKEGGGADRARAGPLGILKETWHPAA